MNATRARLRRLAKSAARSEKNAQKLADAIKGRYGISSASGYIAGICAWYWHDEWPCKALWELAGHTDGVGEGEDITPFSINETVKMFSGFLGKECAKEIVRVREHIHGPEAVRMNALRKRINKQDRRKKASDW